jgi:hypothetical protein
MASAAVLLMTHFLDDGIVAQYRRLKAEAVGLDVFLLYNRSDDPAPGFPVPADVEVSSLCADKIRALGYPRKGLRLNARDVELFVMLFRRRHPDYAHYWIVEYDVDFSGRWSVLFDAFAASPADLLATTVHRFAVNPKWPNWNTVEGPLGPLPTSCLLRAFMPCCRLSGDALTALDRAYALGWSGHYEATVPTLVADAGLSIEDMGGEGEFVAAGNRNRFYTNTPANNHLAPGSFVFRPVRSSPGMQANLLWHPVKPTIASTGWETGKIRRLSRWINRRMASL